MAEEKFASLSSGLLARKGAAKPAMRRQGFMGPGANFQEDLGWNDMGYEAPRPIDGEEEIEAPVPEVRQQLDRLADDYEHADDGYDVGNDGAEESCEDESYTPHVNGNHGGLSPVETPRAVAQDVSAEPVFEPAPIEEQVAAPVSVPEAEIEAEVEDEPVAPEPARVVEQIVRKAADSVPARQKAAFTLRLDRERHLKLRLASAVRNRSAQQIVTEALDGFLATMPELDALAERASNDTQH